MLRTPKMLFVVTLLVAFVSGCCGTPCRNEWSAPWTHETSTAWNLEAYETPCE